MPKAVYSLTNVKMGAVGTNGAMGATLADITQISAGSLTMTFPEPNRTNIIPEDGTVAFVSLKEDQSKTIDFESLNMELPALQRVFGGTNFMSNFTPGVNFSLPDQSFQFTTRPLGGTSQTWKFPRVQVFGSIAGSAQKTDVFKLKYSITVLQPYGGLAAINAFGAITGGSLYVNGTYLNVPLTGGAGTGATADITVAGGAVTTVVKRAPGTGYVIGNPLSAAAANLGGAGSGFSIVVSTVIDTPALADFEVVEA